MKRLLLFALLCVLMLAMSGCIQQETKKGIQAKKTKSIKEQAIESCEALCKEALSKGIDLSNGPCLSTSNPEWKIEGWVCDIAHNPRIPEIDNLKENQCPEWGVSAHSFVEFTPKCEFIRAYEGE